MAIEEYLSPDHSIPTEVTILFSLIGSTLGLVSFIASDWATPVYGKHSNRIKVLGLWRVCRHVDQDESNRIGCFSLAGTEMPRKYITSVLSLVTYPCLWDVCWSE